MKLIGSAILLFFLTSCLPVKSYKSLKSGDSGFALFSGIDSSTEGIPLSPNFGAGGGIDVDPNNFNVVNLAQRCASKCKRDKQLEIDLEIEFWGLALTTNISGMEAWVQKIERYTKESNSQYSYRFYKMASFGLSMVFASGSLNLANFSASDANSITAIFSARDYAQRALAIEPNDIAAFYTRQFVDGFVYAAGDDKKKFLEFSNSMIDIYKNYNMVGYEGITFGNMMKVFSADKELVKDGLKELNNCSDRFCLKRPALIPYRRYGILLSMIEGALYLGSEKVEPGSNKSYNDKAREYYSIAQQGFKDEEKRIKKLSACKKNRGCKEIRDYQNVKNIFDNAYSQITSGLENRTNSLINQWKEGSEFLGTTRLPTGPFQKANNCILCHSGVKVFEHYYTGRKPVEKIPLEQKQANKKVNSDCSKSPNTATKIKLQCSKFNWGYGSTFTYWGQKVRKINNDWANNDTFKCFCVVGR